jgi:hypothetical protein
MAEAVKAVAETTQAEERNDTEANSPHPGYDDDALENRAEKDKYPGEDSKQHDISASQTDGK